MWIIELCVCCLGKMFMRYLWSWCVRNAEQVTKNVNAFSDFTVCTVSFQAIQTYVALILKYFLVYLYLALADLYYNTRHNIHVFFVVFFLLLLLWVSIQFILVVVVRVARQFRVYIEKPCTFCEQRAMILNKTEKSQHHNYAVVLKFCFI